MTGSVLGEVLLGACWGNAHLERDEQNKQLTVMESDNDKGIGFHFEVEGNRLIATSGMLDGMKLQ